MCFLVTKHNNLLSQSKTSTQTSETKSDFPMAVSIVLGKFLPLLQMYK